MKKNILLTSIISMILIPNIASAGIRFNMPNIEQPKEIVSDWDGDGIPNNFDDDDDGDGILDINDNEIYSKDGRKKFVAPKEPVCEGFYWAGSIAGDVHFYHSDVIFGGGVPSSVILFWDNVQVSPTLNQIPQNESNAYEVNGFKYWVDYSNLLQDNDPVFFYYRTKYYGICKLEI